MQNLKDSIKTVNMGPFYKHGLTLIPIWISYHMPSRVWDKLTYPMTTEIQELINTLMPYFIIDVIIHLCWDYSKTNSVKGPQVLIRLVVFHE